MALVPFPKDRSQLSKGSPLADLFGDVSVLERLDDLRRRMVRIALAICVGLLAGFTLIGQVVDLILAPTRSALPAGTEIIYTDPGEAFSLYIQVALIVGIVFAMPYIMFQIWQLIAPFVPKGARRFTGPFVLFTTLGFIGGASFTHYIAFPYMMSFFASFDTPELRFMPRLDDVFSLYTKMLLGMGAVFQMPTVVFFLSKAGLVTARFLWRSFRYAFFVIFIVAAIITPTGDMVTQSIFAAPMVGLYLLSIVIAWVFGRRRPTSDPQDDSLEH